MTSLNRRAVGHVRAMRARIETAAAPRTLYLSRNVLNAEEIATWAREQGFKDIKPELFHVTIAYSKAPVNWMKLGSDYYFGSNGAVSAGDPLSQFPDGSMIIPAGGPRLIERFDGGAVVLLFSCDSFGYRFSRVLDIGGSTDYPNYQPHITIAYDEGSVLDISKMKPYQGRIVFGPEIFAELDEDWKEKNYSDSDLVASVEEAKSMQWFMFKGAANSLDGSNVPLDNGDSFGVIENTIYLNNPKGGKMVKIAVDAKRVTELLKMSEKTKGNMAFGKKKEVAAGVAAALEKASTQIDPVRSGVAFALAFASVKTVDPEANYCVQPDGKWLKEGSSGYDCRAEPIKGKDLPKGAECAIAETASWSDIERRRGVARVFRAAEMAAFTPKAGDEIENQAEDGKWYFGTVTKVKGEQITILYHGATKPTTTWPEFVRPSKKGPPKPKPATKDAAPWGPTAPAGLSKKGKATFELVHRWMGDYFAANPKLSAKEKIDYGNSVLNKNPGLTNDDVSLIGQSIKDAAGGGPRKPVKESSNVLNNLRDELGFTGSAKQLKGDSTKEAVEKVLNNHGFKPVTRDPKAVGTSDGLSTTYSHPQRGMARVYHSQKGKVNAINFA